VALAMTAPVFVWNARHGWASFAFQGSRGLVGSGLRPVQVLQMALGQIAYLFPWLFAALVAGLAAAWRHRDDERRLFLLCLALPPILLFTVTPLWGEHGRPHWAMPGWFFAFPLMGVWLDETAISDRALRRWAFVSVSVLAAAAAIVVLQSSTGWPLRLMAGQRAFADPTLETFDWRALRNAPLLRPPPLFVVSTKWSDAGKIAFALGPDIPVLVISDDPRGWAFVDDSEKYVGHDGVLVVKAADLDSARRIVSANFASVGDPQFYSLTRNGYPEIELALVPVRALTRRLTAPYRGSAGR
jgi:hypothetical protein